MIRSASLRATIRRLVLKCCKPPRIGFWHALKCPLALVCVAPWDRRFYIRRSRFSYRDSLWLSSRFMTSILHVQFGLHSSNYARRPILSGNLSPDSLETLDFDDVDVHSLPRRSDKHANNLPPS